MVSKSGYLFSLKSEGFIQLLDSMNALLYKNASDSLSSETRVLKFRNSFEDSV